MTTLEFLRKKVNDHRTDSAQHAKRVAAFEARAAPALLEVARANAAKHVAARASDGKDEAVISISTYDLPIPWTLVSCAMHGVEAVDDHDARARVRGTACTALAKEYAALGFHVSPCSDYGQFSVKGLQKIFQ